jgi:O-antigen ligase
VLLLAAGQLKYRPPAWPIWHLGIVTTFAVGSLVAALSFGELSSYEWVNKDAGLLLPFLSYAAVTSTVTEWEDLRRILRIFTWSVGFENIVAVAAFLGAYFFGTTNPFARYGPRLSGMLLDPNAYGGLLVVALVVAEGASWGPVPLFKGASLWVIRTTLALGILFTFSRSAWTGLGFALLLFGAVRPKVAGRLLLAGLLSAPVLLLFMGRHFWPFFQEMASRPEQVQQRFDLIERALQSFARDPWLGGGLGSFRLGAGEVAHNSAMWFLADFGVVGLAALIGFLAWFFAIGWFAYRRAPEPEKPLALALLLAHAAMLGLAMGIEAFYQRHWWLVFGLIASSYCMTLRPARPRAGKPEVLAHAHF